MTKVVFGCRRSRLSPFGHQLLERRKLFGRIAAAREQRELEPAFVLVIDRLPELLRVSGVNEDRQLEPGRRLKDRIERRVVEGKTGSVGLLGREAEALTNLTDAHRTRGHVRFELRHRPLGPPRPHGPEVDPRQKPNPVLHRRRRLNQGDLLLETLPGHVIGRHDQPDVDLVECRPKLNEPLGAAELAGGMAVKVDGRIFGLRHRVRRRF